MAIEVIVPGVPEPILVEIGGGGGVGTVVDAVANGNANAVSSNAVFDAINALSFAGSDPNKSRMVVTGTSYPEWANQTLIYAGLFNGKPSWTTDGLTVFGASFEGRMMLFYAGGYWSIETSSDGEEGGWPIYAAYMASAASFPDGIPLLVSNGTGDAAIAAEALPANFLGQWCKSSAAMWQWNGTTWEAWAESLVGEQGPAGAQGIQGPAGPAGPTGAQNLSVILTAPENGDVNTITLKDSTTLKLTLGVGVWQIKALIIVSAGASFATAGSRQKLHFSGTGTWAAGDMQFASSNATAVLTSHPSTRLTLAVDGVRAVAGSSTATLRAGVLTVTVPGDLVVQFAQNVAVAAAFPILEAGSWLDAIPTTS